MLDRWLDAAARRVLDWSARHSGPSRGPWIDALRGELELVESSPGRLLWALGGLAIICSTRRTTLMRIWRSLPGPLRIGGFGLALAVALVVAIIWSNVVVPSHESDSEYGGWYAVFYLGLFAYFGLSGFLAVRGGSSIGVAALTGGATAVLSVGNALVTFIIIDNVFLDVVMQQPDKAYGFAHSGLSSQRGYVNQGNLAIAVVLPVIGGLGAVLGIFGGLMAMRLVSRHAEVA